MGFLDSAWNWVAGWVAQQGGGGVISGSAASEVAQAYGRQVIGRELVDLLFPDLPPTGRWYEGPAFRAPRIGWPIQISIEANGTPGNLPQGTFFVCHPPDCLFDSMTLTMTGADPVDDPRQTAGMSARLVQVDGEGRTLFVSGPELDITDQGIIRREDLRLAAKSPFFARESYGGPVDPYLPMFVVVAPFGNWGGITGVDYLQVQVTVTLLCQQVQ